MIPSNFNLIKFIRISDPTDPITPPILTTPVPPPVTNPTPPTISKNLKQPSRWTWFLIKFILVPDPPGPPAQICAGQRRRFVAHPGSCYQWFWCNLLGLPGPVGTCDPDRIFVELLQGCILGNQQTCQRNSNIVPGQNWTPETKSTILHI